MKPPCPPGGAPIALAGPCAGTAGLMRDGRLVQFGELCGVSADVRFAPDFVRSTPSSGRGRHPRLTSQFDPKLPLPVLGETHMAGLSSALCHSVAGAMSRIRIRSR